MIPFFEACACALYDLKFLTRWELRAGLYRAVETCPATEGAGSASMVHLAKDQIVPGGMPCFWCLNRKRFHADCGYTVCGARVKGDMFHCRPSCPEVWKTGHAADGIDVAAAEGRKMLVAPKLLLMGK